MDNDFDSTDRRAGDYLLFTLAAIGSLIAAGGIILSSAVTAFLGWALAVLCVLGFRGGPAPGE